MSDTAIKVENLSKSYQIKKGQTGGYTALRDVLTEGAVDFWNDIKTLKSPFGGKKESELFWALKDVNFEVKKGEILGIIGRNGAGKSTLLKILSRITEPDAGRVILNGRVSSLLEVGTGFHPELTGRENIFLSGAILGMRREEIKKHFDEIVDFAGVEKFIDTPVKRYSSGMYVRLGFAVAAHLETEILLVDEVLAVGDVEYQKRCIERVKKISIDGKSVIIISHDLETVVNLCKNGLLIDKGEIICKGSIVECIDYYKKFSFGSIVQNKTLVNVTNGINFYVNGVKDNKCKPGDSIEITTKFPKKGDTLFPVLGLVIKNYDFRKVISINNKMYGQFKQELKEEQLFRVKINDLFNLPSGGYSIDFHYGNHMGDFEVIQDAVHFSFVQENICLGTEKKNNLYILPMVSWEVS